MGTFQQVTHIAAKPAVVVYYAIECKTPFASESTLFSSESVTTIHGFSWIASGKCPQRRWAAPIDPHEYRHLDARH